eukprot:3187118-Rhodomonas_salina.2
MIVNRFRFAMTASISPEKLYVLGGFNVKRLRDVQEFDPGALTPNVSSLCRDRPMTPSLFLFQSRVPPRAAAIATHQEPRSKACPRALVL